MNLINFIRNFSFEEDKTTEYYIEKLRNVLQIHKNESEDYKRALIRRMISTLNSITLLRSNNLFLETPTLLRVTFESASRLYQYTYHKNSVTRKHVDAYKILGVSPTPKYTIDKMGEAKEVLNYTYRFLCGFAHPDVLSLILSLEDEENNKALIDMISKYSIVGILYIIAKIYPNDVDESDFVSMIASLGGFIFEKTIEETQQEGKLEAFMQLLKEENNLFADIQMNEILQDLNTEFDNMNDISEVEDIIKRYLNKLI
ncbi:hypothetical protein [Paenibacillus wenxiniae]|uniref:Uncharacterized protein n=1 Tax=Paenibacillus wenxiniae TaxID=1636843 RepID=A0ABW4RL23_9BACL